MGKLVLFVSFIVIAPVIFLVSLAFFLYIAYQKTSPHFSNGVNISGKSIAYASLPTFRNISEGKIEQKDARIELVRQFFLRYDSPLEPYANEVVAKADQYGLDFRLMPAIAMQESNLCKKAPENSYNCWGFGIYDSKIKRFSGYAEAIDIVTKTLAEQYKKNGLKTPEEIMTRYTPSSNGSWAYSVSHFMNILQ